MDSSPWVMHWESMYLKPGLILVHWKANYYSQEPMKGSFHLPYKPYFFIFRTSRGSRVRAHCLECPIRIKLLSYVTRRCSQYSRVNSRLADTPIIRTAAKSLAKINYRRLTKINNRYYVLSLLRTLTHGPEGVRKKGSWLYSESIGE